MTRDFIPCEGQTPAEIGAVNANIAIDQGAAQDYHVALDYFNNMCDTLNESGWRGNVDAFEEAKAAFLITIKDYVDVSQLAGNI